MSLKKTLKGTSLAVQWLGLRTAAARGRGSIPGLGTKIPHAAQHGQRKKKRKKRKEKYSQQTILIENNIYISNIVDNMIILIII